jgi:hypothetical protein
MATTPQQIEPQTLAQVSGLSNSANTTIYTTPASTTTQIDMIIVCEKSANATTLNLDHYNGATGYNIMVAYPLAANETLIIRGPLTLDAGDLLRGSASAASRLDINVYGSIMTQ